MAQRFPPHSVVRLNNSNIIGESITVYGNNNIINTSLSVVCGNNNRVTGTQVIVTGNRNTVVGDRATVTGNSTTLIGQHATVTGNHTTVRGDFATTVGNWSSITGENARVTGNSNRVTGDNAVVRGRENTVTGENNQNVVPEQQQQGGVHIMHNIQHIGSQIGFDPEAFLAHFVCGTANGNVHVNVQQEQQPPPRTSNAARRPDTGNSLVTLTLRGEDEELGEEDTENSPCFVCQVNKAVVVGVCCGKLALCIACTRMMYEGKRVGVEKCVNCQEGVHACLRVS